MTGQSRVLRVMVNRVNELSLPHQFPSIRTRVPNTDMPYTLIQHTPIYYKQSCLWAHDLTSNRYFIEEVEMKNIIIRLQEIDRTQYIIHDMY